MSYKPDYGASHWSSNITWDRRTTINESLVEKAVARILQDLQEERLTLREKSIVLAITQRRLMGLD